VPRAWRECATRTGGCLCHFESRPGALELDQAGLDEILRRVPVAGEQDRDPQVVVAAITDVRGEVFVRVAAVASHPSSFRLCSLSTRR
jgi:hypothetical protein